MKKEVVLIIAILLLPSALSIEQTLSDSYLNRTSSSILPLGLGISELKYEPYPVKPGEFFTLWVMVINQGNDDLKNVKIEFVDRYPFSYPEQKVIEISTLGSRQEKLVKFENIKVDEKAVEGDNELYINLYRGIGYTGYATKSLKIRVQEVSPLLSLTISSEPEKIPQGSIANITINLKNDAVSTLKDISVKLNLTDPFVPVGSTNEKKVVKLLPKETATLNFNIMPLADSAAKAYSIPATITYYDEPGTKYEKDEIIGLLVGSEPDYYIDIKSSANFKKNSRGEVVLSISNTGPSDLKFFVLELLPSKDYSVLSNSKVYIGNLESDDYETAEFDIFVKNKNPDLKLKLIYKDSYNNPFENTIELPLKVYSSSELKLYGFTKQAQSPLLYLILIILVYITFKEWRKEKNIAKALKNTLKISLKFIIKTISGLRWRYIKRIPKKIKIFLE